MPVYVWAGKTKKGRSLKGELEAADERIARIQLKKRSIEVKKLKPKPKDLFENISFMQPKVTNKDLVIFTRQFSTMIDAGLPLVQGGRLDPELVQSYPEEHILDSSKYKQLLSRVS